MRMEATDVSGEQIVCAELHFQVAASADNDEYEYD